ncbi:hypothetical protein [Chitinophaga sp.]|uniref:hypothetical protein n=1 Tax=Chitinophaga sp. TaxID=1869181 RepID=UPI002F948A16
MLHTLSHPAAKHTFKDIGTTLISWGTAILLTATGFPILLQLLKQLLMLLYEILVQYRY